MRSNPHLLADRLMAPALYDSLIPLRDGVGSSQLAPLPNDDRRKLTDDMIQRRRDDDRYRPQGQSLFRSVPSLQAQVYRLVKSKLCRGVRQVSIVLWHVLLFILRNLKRLGSPRLIQFRNRFERLCCDTHLIETMRVDTVAQRTDHKLDGRDLAKIAPALCHQAVGR